MDRHLKRSGYFEIEELRQELANAAVLDINKFKATYDEPFAYELFPIEKTHPEYYEGNEAINGWTHWRLNAVLSLIPKDTDRLINVGSGWEGSLANACLIHNPKMNYTAFDQLPKDKYMGPGRVKYICGNATELDKHFESGSFDVCVSMEMMEHIPPTQTMKVWQNMNHLLKPGGLLILTIPYTENLKKFSMYCPICCEWIIESGHVRAYPPSVVEAELKVNGFKLIETMKGPNNMYAYKAIKL